MKTLRTIGLVLVVSCVLTSCYTARGFGEDVSASGHAVSRAVSGY